MAAEESTKICHLCKTERNISEFYSYHKACKCCIQSRHRLWKQRNREKHLQLMRDWYIRNRDKQLEIKLQYYIDNRDRHQEWATKWRLENREKWIWQAKDWKHKNPDRANESNRRRKKINRHKVNAQTAKRRFRKAMATPKWANHDKILAFYENARVATEQTGIIHHVDHIVPLKGRNACGLHCEDNLQVITAQENLIKHNKVIE